ncbi:hypothetical protein [Clostridium ganghwense]|uniref:CopG family transcriptional regulator n=1 Tax=Clostridium ganghwense TaxID=312089 RepID=A0ABT4CLH2_9CLOT|nr:hypothetical protein [Clostridium ganghwense]MCY6369328.1 hypothetical protein [Clostridium ganghwense]
MSKVVENYTFSLPVNLLNKLNKYSNDGYASSINTAVEEAIKSYVKSIEKQKLYNEITAGSKDPLFSAELKNVLNNFY